jgi:inhibitor of cysteine peptidase
MKFPKIFVTVTTIIGLLCLVAFFVVMIIPTVDLDPIKPIFNPSGDKDSINKVDNFSSSEEFKEYLQEASEQSGYMGISGGMQRGIMVDSMPMAESMDFAMDTSKAGMGGGGGEPSRVSETNVQVEGIDEPDIVKTNGKEIFASLQAQYRSRILEGGARELIYSHTLPPNERPEPGIKTIKAFPVDELGLSSEIDRQGEMLLYEDTLVIFSNNKIYGYDISDPNEPEEVWDVDYSDNNTYLVTSRLYKGTIYLVLRTYVTPDSVCPVPLLKDSRGDVEVGCKYIYHPVAPVPTDSTYTVVKLDPTTGEVNKRVSFTGSNSASQVYMSENAVYVSYYYPGDMVKYMFGFFKENKDIAPDWLMDKTGKLLTYDISSQAKLSELSVLFQRWHMGLSDDDRLMVENEMEDRMSDYSKKYKRELERTGIAKITLDNMKVDSAGSVPGVLLNQFAMDEYQDNLRVATTVSAGTMFGNWGGGESESDVYVLDEDMEEIGSVLGMGLTERIYSVRFIQDKGYVVTFRQTDPFYVLDLSNPKEPEIKGELKIPGYSSYLHPIDEDRILGIGKEGSKVKLSLFNVSDPENPFEEDKYMMDEYYSEALNNHHAFLMDHKFKIFFMPGSKGGYIFSYENNELELKKAIGEVYPKRALFIDDYLYIVTDYSVVVLDEKTWERVEELDF